MSPDELREQTAVEFESMEQIIHQLFLLAEDVKGREPSVREKTAGGAFLAQFYSGVENILKRICLYEDISLPEGEMWHLDLFEYFASPVHRDLPELFDAELSSSLAPYRRFRHVALHSYGFQLDWQRMQEGVRDAPKVFYAFRIRVEEYLRSLDS